MYAKLNYKIRQLSNEDDESKSVALALEVANEVLIILSGSSYESCTPDMVINDINKVDTPRNIRQQEWFRPHPKFSDQRMVLKLYTTNLLDVRFMWLSRKTTKAQISASTLLSPNWQDTNQTRTKNYKVGIDIFFCIETKSLLVAFSNFGSVRILELTENLSLLQMQTLQKLSGALSETSQEYIHSRLWEQLSLDEHSALFYKAVLKHYELLVRHLILDDRDKEAAKAFASRLLIRLLFVRILSVARDCPLNIGCLGLSDHDSTLYYESMLKPLFFCTLGQPNDECNFAARKIPLIDGGLFTPYVDDWVNENVSMPTGFFNDLYETLDKYNFVAYENSDDYEVIAIGPAVLGQLYEGLLGMQFTDAGEVLRKASGAYYTRQEIVDYMCKESLRLYLRNSLNDEDSHEGLDQLVDVCESEWYLVYDITKDHTGPKKFTALTTQRIVGALDDLVLLDPACGAGAFPLGMLRQILKLYERLGTPRDALSIKLGIVRNNIYGLDLDSTAVAIARARLLLSIVNSSSLRSAYDIMSDCTPRILCADSLGEENISSLFGVKKFDIVISNPPYIGEKGRKELFRNISNGRLGKYYLGKMDIYYFFFHLALDLLADGGIATFITTNYYLTANGAKKLRADIKLRSSIKLLFDFCEMQLFSSAPGQHNVITILERSDKPDDTARIMVCRAKGIVTKSKLFEILRGSTNYIDAINVRNSALFTGAEDYIDIPVYGIKVDDINTLINKLTSDGAILGKLCHINQGIISGADIFSVARAKNYPGIPARVGDGIFVHNIDAPDFTHMRPWYKSSNIQRYVTDNVLKRQVLYLSPSSSPDEIEQRVLQKYKPILSKRREVVNGHIPWWALQWSRNENIFKGPKIVVPQRSVRNTFGYNELDWYASADVYFITAKSDSVQLKYILALLNSKLYYVWLYCRGKRKGETLELYHTPLSHIPVRIASRKIQMEIVHTVDEIINFKIASGDTDTLHLECELDERIYELYKLTSKEVALVEKIADKE